MTKPKRSDSPQKRGYVISPTTGSITFDLDAFYRSDEGKNEARKVEELRDLIEAQSAKEKSSTE